MATQFRKIVRSSVIARLSATALNIVGLLDLRNLLDHPVRCRFSLLNERETTTVCMELGRHPGKPVCESTRRDGGLAELLGGRGG